MSGEVTLEADGEITWRVSGPLNFKTVPVVWDRTAELLKDSSTLVFDLQGVTRSDSAALALLIELRREARRRNKDIILRNIPPQLRAISSVSGLDELLGR